MNDRFKFRVWDKPISEMSYDVCIGFIKDGATRDWVCADTTCGQVDYLGERLKDIELMQCTGLKDKNGKLIYEGDIIQIQGDTGKAKVEYNLEKGMFLLIGKKYAPSAFMTIRKDYWEVIGNIYENPELL